MYQFSTEYYILVDSFSCVSVATEVLPVTLVSYFCELS